MNTLTHPERPAIPSPAPAQVGAHFAPCCLRLTLLGSDFAKPPTRNQRAANSQWWMTKWPPLAMKLTIIWTIINLHQSWTIKMTKTSNHQQYCFITNGDKSLTILHHDFLQRAHFSISAMPTPWLAWMINHYSTPPQEVLVAETAPKLRPWVRQSLKRCATRAAMTVIHGGELCLM